MDRRPWGGKRARRIMVVGPELSHVWKLGWQSAKSERDVSAGWCRRVLILLWFSD